MAEQIMSASGTQYGVAVGEDNRLWVDAAISGIPTVNANITGSIMIGSVSAQVDSIYVQSGDNINISSMPEVVGVSGTYFQDIIGSVQVNSGSIFVTNMAANSGYAGSDSYIKAGSVIVTNIVGVSGDIFTNGDLTGSVVVSSGNIDVDNLYTGSESFIPAGSIIITNYDKIGSIPIQTITGDVGITGSIMIGSVLAFVDSIYIQSGNQVEMYGSGLFTGSIMSLPEVVGVSGIYFQDMIGSVRSQNIQITSPWIIGGSVAMTNAGSVIQSTSPWIIVGSVYQTNSTEITTGSTSYNYVKSGTVWIDEPEYRKVVPSGTLTIAGTVTANTGLYAGSNAYIPAGSVIITNNITLNDVDTIGSYPIQTVDGIVTANTGLYAGSDAYVVAGSVIVTNNISIDSPATIGSYDTQNIIGSVQIDGGSLYVTNFEQGTGYAGSDVYVKAGSVIVTNNIAIANPATIGSLSTQTIDGTVTSNSAVAGSVEIWQKTAADMIVTIDSPKTIGSYTTQTVDGTISVTDLYTGSDSYIPAGSVIITNNININNPETIGSFPIQTVDGTITVSDLATAGSIPIQTIDGTVTVSDLATAGSLPVQTIDGTVIVSDLATAGSIPVQTIDGTVTATTGLYAGSDSYIPAGSVIITNNIGIDSPAAIGSYTGMSNGSVIVINSINDVGSPCFKRGILTASGTYTNVWPIGGTGSKLEIHGYHISTNNPGYVRLCRSGTTPIVISDWNLNYTSGATIEKTFCNPIVPNAADVPVGIGATVAGSTCVTIYGREVK